MNIRAAMLLPALALCVQAFAAPLTPEQQAVHVLNRIAFGPAPGDIARVTRMGLQQYIDSQLAPQELAYPQDLARQLAALELANMATSEVFGAYVELRKDARNEDEGAKEKRRKTMQRLEQETGQARLARAIGSPRQLEEVMVDFWYNHFNVFSGKGIDRALVGSYEREAIRPYVFGAFRELLGATARHPAMLYYLDNHLSRAPGKDGKGPNENYARELMELHTIGVDGGYTQKDVTELARMLTGWTYNPRALIQKGETFRFDERRHDRDTKVWLGRTVRDMGQREGEMALDVLAMHPATAHRISTKLAQYFVQDEPPPALVERMARTYLDSKGEIRAVLRTLFASGEFMAPEAVGAKFKTPYQFVVSAARAAGVPVTNTKPLSATLRTLGMPLYGCQTPDGYKNTQQAWLNPDALTRRVSFATALAAGRLSLSDQGMAPDAVQLEATLGPSVSGRTLGMAADSPAPLRAAMLLGGPDFMQR